MKLSVFNPTGSRVSIATNGRFPGAVIRSLFAVRGFQEFEVSCKEHADWLMNHIKAACPSAQVKLQGHADTADEPGLTAAAILPTDPVVVDPLPVADVVIPSATEEQLTPPVVDEAMKEVIEESATTKAAGKKSKPVAETKE